MSGILYLNVDDFVIRKGEKGNLLCLNYDVRGLSLVLFYSNECQHCNRLLVQYKQLPYNINGCQFTMINVNRVENRRVVSMSNQTIVPITYVPDIILYVDGIPYMRYDGNHDIQSIKTFILEIYQQLQKTASMNPFMDTRGGGQPQQPRASSASSNGLPPRPPTTTTPSPPQAQTTTTTAGSAIPAYTIGRPKRSGPREDVSYVSFSEAYHGASPSSSSSNGPSSNGSSQPVFYTQRQ